MAASLLSHIPPLVRAVAFATVFFLASTALGSRLLTWLRMPQARFSKLERGFLSASLGTASVQLLPYTLAAARRMTPMGVCMACAALVAFLVPDMVRIASAGFRMVVASRPRPSRPALIWGSLVTLVLAVLLVHTVVVGSLGDDDGYHLSSPRRWLEAGTLSYLPSYTNTNGSLGFEMLYAVALSVADAGGAKALHFGAGLFTFFGLFLCAKRLEVPLAAVLAISLLLVRTPFVDLQFIFHLAFADLGVTWMAMAALLVWMVWRERGERSLLVWMAVFAGFAGSFKFTSLAFVLAWMPILFLDQRRHGRTVLRCLEDVALFGSVAALPLFPWFARNAVVTGNPLYPLLSSVVPTRDWSPEHAQVFSRLVHYYSWGIAAGSRLGEGQRQILLVAAGGLLVGFGLAAFFFVRNEVLRSMLLLSATFAFACLSLTGLILRYWLPGTLIAALGVAALTTSGWSRTRSYVVASVLAAIALVQSLRLPPSGSLLPDLRGALGLAPDSRELPDDPLWKVWDYANTATPPDARILAASFYTSMGESGFGGLPVDRAFYTTDAHLQSYIRLDSWPEFVKSLVDAKVSYVVIFDGAITPARFGFSFPAGDNEYPFCRRLVDEYGEKLVQAGRAQFYRVWPGRAAAAAEEPAMIVSIVRK